MGLLEIASSKSVWRGIEYYKDHKVLSLENKENGIYDGIVEGSGNVKYTVHVDSIHPRKSTCNCPLADGKKIICKHIVAVYVAEEPKEEQRFKTELTPYSSGEEERYAKRFQKYMSWARNMSLSQLRKAYIEAMIRLEELEYDKKYKKQ